MSDDQQIPKNDQGLTGQGGFLFPPEVSARLLEVVDKVADWRFEKRETLHDGALETYAIILIWPDGTETGLFEDHDVFGASDAD
jgi:hypothetical protein